MQFRSGMFPEVLVLKLVSRAELLGDDGTFFSPLVSFIMIFYFD